MFMIQGFRMFETTYVMVGREDRVIRLYNGDAQTMRWITTEPDNAPFITNGGNVPSGTIKNVDLSPDNRFMVTSGNTAYFNILSNCDLSIEVLLEDFTCLRCANYSANQANKHICTKV